MLIEKILIEYAKPHLALVHAQEQVAQLQTQMQAMQSGQAAPTTPVQQ